MHGIKKKEVIESEGNYVFTENKIKICYLNLNQI